ncbi:cytosine deaminase [Neurospora tetrasperma FGSC 2508]|uniref:Cytosine deaminase n=1 Tax=Neurospora tetrasperma (strain FGSC 2508 / ATCC MYA-4615 / P0657) TaxID=510951 RepID=F8N1I2_NEUT8|nr:cytosine deaminase [Neurospora tetrasperma FGSC 2508]EGO52313.1 cytosine deaminase [Neurospora tetrasperma FGSC 2508]
MDDAAGLAIAFEEAKKSYEQGGIPIGAALISSTGTVLGRGHNQRVQLDSPIHHGETATLLNAGRLPASTYANSTMYTTLSPCDMCTGAILLYKIPRVVIGENSTFKAAGEDYLRQRGVEVVVMDDQECRTLMERFVRESPGVWWEDIGVVGEEKREQGDDHVL